MSDSTTRKRDEPVPAEVDLFYQASNASAVPLGDSVVCWIDLLGVREGLVSSARSGDEDTFVAGYLSVLGPLYRALDWQFRDTDYRWNAFTDSIVISVPVASAHPEATIGLLCDAAAELQFRLSLQGWFARGGVAVGPLHASKQFVIGSGLMEAYELEGKEAVVPRIIVDADVRNAIPRFVAYYAYAEDSPQNQSFILDADGHIFINYLYAPLAVECDMSALDRALLRHREQVTRHLDAHRNPGRIRAKYLWVAAYHNWFCEQWRSAGDVASLQIPGIQPVAFRRLRE